MPTPQLQKLQIANQGLKEEVRAFKAEVRKLQTQKAKLEAKHTSMAAEVAAAKERIKALEKLKIPEKSDPFAGMSENEKARRFLFAVNKALNLVQEKEST